jgi:hypothetical protein
VLIPTKRCELRFMSQKPNLELPILTLEIGYPHNIEQDVFQTKTPYPNYSFYHGCPNVKWFKSWCPSKKWQIMFYSNYIIATCNLFCRANAITWVRLFDFCSFLYYEIWSSLIVHFSSICISTSCMWLIESSNATLFFSIISTRLLH